MKKVMLNPSTGQYIAREKIIEGEAVCWPAYSAAELANMLPSFEVVGNIYDQPEPKDITDEVNKERKLLT